MIKGTQMKFKIIINWEKYNVIFTYKWMFASVYNLMLSEVTSYYQTFIANTAKNVDVHHNEKANVPLDVF